MAACARVFGIAELADEILLHLTLRQLIIIRRVSRYFQRAVDESSPIRKALWLEQTTTNELSRSSPAGPWYGFFWRSRVDREAERPRANPFIWQIFRPQMSRNSRLSGHPPRPELHTNDSRHVYTTDSQGIWRRMALTYPPIRRIVLEDSDDYCARLEAEGAYTYYPYRSNLERIESEVRRRIKHPCMADIVKGCELFDQWVIGKYVGGEGAHIWGSHHFIWPDETIDDITGHQMLSMLRERTVVEEDDPCDYMEAYIPWMQWQEQILAQHERRGRDVSRPTRNLGRDPWWEADGLERWEESGKEMELLAWLHSVSEGLE